MSDGRLHSNIASMRRYGAMFDAKLLGPIGLYIRLHRKLAANLTVAVKQPVKYVIQGQTFNEISALLLLWDE